MKRVKKQNNDKNLKDKKRSILSRVFLSVMILLAALLWAALYGYLFQSAPLVLCRNLLLGTLMAFLIVFSFVMADGRNAVFSWNKGHMGRFAVIICLCVVFLAGMGQVPFLAAPVSALAVILTVYSGGVVGIISYSALILQYCILNGFSVTQLTVLLLTGLVGAALFMSLDKSFRYGGILFTYFVADFVCYSLFFVLTESGQALGDALLYTGIRLFSAFVALLVILKLLGAYSIYRDDNALAGINNPEYKLLVELKSVNREAYFHAIHTAYLSERIARRIGADTALAKAGGYYHKIGILQGKDTIQNTLLIGAANEFPESLIRLLKEYGIKNMQNVSREAAVVQLADAVVSSVSYLFQKDRNAVLNYDKVVDVIIKKKLDSGDFEHCELTMEELCEIKNGFVEERLYYDFLR